jgi:hypothetical protein
MEVRQTNRKSRQHRRGLIALAIVCALGGAAPLAAQGISPGVWAGVTITPLIRTDGGGDNGPLSYVIGPALDIPLWRGVRAGAALLLGAARLPEGPSPPTVRRWELPVTATWTPGALPGRPYLRAGFSWNRVFAISGARGSPPAEMRHRGTHGPVIGAGLELRGGRLRLMPEIRLTRWVDRNFGVRDSAVRSNLTQIEILAGVRF